MLVGDFRYKDLRLPKEEYAVSAEPDIIVRERGDDEWLLFGCDGVFDVMQNQQVSQFMRSSLQELSPKLANESLLNECLNRSSRDNITSLLVLLKPKQ